MGDAACAQYGGCTGLPYTGMDVTPFLVIGLALIALGVVIALLDWRRGR